VLFEVFLLNKVSFELDTSMKDPCITREQSLGIHKVVNDQGFAMHCRVMRINTAAKQNDRLTSIVMLNVLEAKIFQYDFLERHNV